ncbi:NAC domain-containing protein [Trifolium repens]|nr:NAC domain-containing protein [Trifolium repens]
MALNSSTFTDDELLRPFLYNKIHNIPLPNYINILEQDLFGTVKNPWEIWEEFKDSHSYCGKDIYVFSILRKKSATSTRVVRTIGIGAWEGEDTGKSIFAKDTNRLLGIRKRYRFEKSAYEHGGWILHEYSLDKSLITNPSAKNYVLCRFRKNLKRGLQNTETRIYHQPNSHITNCSVVPRKKPRMNNVGQDRSQSKTVAVPPCAAATTTISGNTTLLRKYIIYEEPRKESNTTNVVNTNTNSNSQYKEEKGVENNWQETIVIGLEAIANSENNSVWLEENIGQKPRNQLDSENNKTDAVRITNETEREFNKDVECTMNKEDDGDIIINNDNDLIVSKEEGCVTMSWPELFAQELLKKNEGCLIKEEDVPMLSNDFYKDLLFEKYKS